MAAPNLGNLTSIIGKTYLTGSLPSGSASMSILLTNPENSNAAYKINSVTYANLTSINMVASLVYHSASIDYFIANELTIPAKSVLVITSQDTRFMLEESCSLKGYANQTGSITPMISYEVLT